MYLKLVCKVISTIKWRKELNILYVFVHRFLAFTPGPRAAHMPASGRMEKGTGWAWSREAAGCTKESGHRATRFNKQFTPQCLQHICIQGSVRAQGGDQLGGPLSGYMVKRIARWVGGSVPKLNNLAHFPTVMARKCTQTAVSCHILASKIDRFHLHCRLLQGPMAAGHAPWLRD